MNNFAKLRIDTSKKLTGKTRFRRGFTGKLILQVQYEQLILGFLDTSYGYRWRDAKMEDFVNT